MITLYSTGCPKCKVLKKKLDDKGIDYSVNSSVDDMVALGISQVPMLQIDEQMLNFRDAVNLVNSLAGVSA
ncbi:MAG: hypothetical protein NC548_06195 [Lachnospiraceae bacterium]|nr:hypothetical protein [Lachnospiraceae bacterium]